MIVTKCTSTHSASTIALMRWRYQRLACVAPSIVIVMRSELAAHGCARGDALQPGDRGRRREVLRATLDTRALRVARMAAGVAGHRAQAFMLRDVALVVDQRPRAVERRGTQKIGPPCDDIARRIADAAADALDAGIGQLARRRRRRHACE